MGTFDATVVVFTVITLISLAMVGGATTLLKLGREKGE